MNKLLFEEETHKIIGACMLVHKNLPQLTPHLRVLVPLLSQEAGGV
jgi:hypothetical protein